MQLIATIKLFKITLHCIESNNGSFRTLISLESLWPNDAIWHLRTWSTLAQVMACCQKAPSHYLDQCWLIVSEASTCGNCRRLLCDGPTWWHYQMETFPILLALCEGHHQSLSDTGLWYFLWSVPEQMVEQTIKMPVVWDTITLIITSLHHCNVLWWPIASDVTLKHMDEFTQHLTTSEDNCVYSSSDILHLHANETLFPLYRVSDGTCHMDIAYTHKSIPSVHEVFDIRAAVVAGLPRAVNIYCDSQYCAVL